MNWQLYNICYFWPSLKSGFTLSVNLFFFFLFRDGIYPDSAELTLIAESGIKLGFVVLNREKNAFEDALLLSGPAVLLMSSDV